MTRRSITRTRTDFQTVVRLRLAITRLARVVRQHGTTGLTPSQLSALARIEDVGPMRISDLAIRESVGAPVATRVVTTLEELGYLVRLEDPIDRRACLIGLTESGQHVLKQLWEEGTAGLNARIEQLSATDIAILHAALPVLEILARDRTPS
jgi:DNA-binding MarR family transcriptional regulator